MILENSTNIETIKKANTLTVYHSCSVKHLKKRFDKYPDKNIHAGTYYQALCRADYKVNDEELYSEAYIHEIEISLEGLNPVLVKDDGYDSNKSLEDSYKNKYNLLFYKNVGEGKVKDENLSVIILNKKNIISIKLYKVLNGEQIEKLLYSAK